MAKKQEIKLRQIPAPFKIFADFECILKNCDNSVDNKCFSYTRKCQSHVSCSFAYKVVCVDDDFSKKLYCTEEKMLSRNLLNQFLMSTFIAEE